MPAKKKINKALAQLKIDPQAGKKLKGEFSGLWSHRVYPYRIIYRIEKNTVQIVTIGHRQGVYL
jgi:addiction module RelE/StbE family toxin